MPDQSSVTAEGPTDISETLLPRLYERDIDVLLQEELIFNKTLARSFSGALGLPETLRVHDCRLSVSDHTGETDVYALFSCGSRQGVLLIENKIDAAFQPRQPERYRERAALLAAPGKLELVFCVLVAPKSYADSTKAGVEHFNAVVFYEDIAAAIAAESTPRAKHRAALLLRAVDESSAAYTLHPVAEVTALWRRIYSIASAEFPDLGMAPPGDKGASSSWITFKADLPPRTAIDWKITKRSLELTFWQGAAFVAPRDIDLSRLPGGKWQMLGKTTAIGIPGPRATSNWTELSDGQIRDGLAGAQRLLEFYRGNRESFVSGGG